MNTTKTLNIYDLDGTLLYPSPYSILKYAGDLKTQHDVAQSEEFREMLKHALLAQWFEDESVLFPDSILLPWNAKSFIVTGRWDYNESITKQWLNSKTINCPIYFVNFDGYESYLDNKISKIKEIISKNPDNLVIILEDCYDIIQWAKDMGYGYAHVKNGCLNEISIQNWRFKRDGT